MQTFAGTFAKSANVCGQFFTVTRLFYQCYADVIVTPFDQKVAQKLGIVSKKE